MNEFLHRYFSPGDAGGAGAGAAAGTGAAAGQGQAAGGTSASAAGASGAGAAAAGAAAQAGEPGYFIKPDGTYIDKFWEHPAFPADLKDNMQLRTHKGIGDTLANWLGMHKSQGYDKVLIPAKDAKPEVWDQNVWNRLGTPKDAKGYTMPDFAATGLDPKYKAPPEQQEKFLSAVHKARLTDWQFGTLMGEMNAMLKEQIERQEAAAKQATDAAMKPVRTRLGGEYESKRKQLEAFLRSYVKPDRFDSVMDMGLLDEPGTFEMLEQIAPAFAEAQQDLAMVNTPANVLADYEGQVQKLTASKAFTDEFHPEHKATVAKVNELRSVLFAVQAKK